MNMTESVLKFLIKAIIIIVCSYFGLKSGIEWAKKKR